MKRPFAQKKLLTVPLSLSSIAIAEGTWQASNGGIQTDTLNQTLNALGTTYDKCDLESSSYTKSWTDAGLLTYYTDGLSIHHLTDETDPPHQVTNNTSAGLQPVFAGGVVYSQGYVNPSSFSGGNGTGYASFGFPSVPMDAESPATVPDATFGLDDDQGPKTYWETLASWISNGIDTAMDTAVWIVDQISYGVSEAGGFVIRNFEAVLDGIQLALDVAGFVPIFGVIPDVINSGIHLGRGNYLEAGLSAFAAIPLIGDGSKATAMTAKVVTKGADFAASAGQSAMKLAGKFDDVDEVAKIARARTWKYGPVPDGVLGYTDLYGNIVIKRGLTGRQLELTLRHERVHSFLSARPGLLGAIRARIGVWAYGNSHFMRYIEEALAETYATKQLLHGLTFPIREGYVTAGRVLLEGAVYAGFLGPSTYLGYRVGRDLFE